MPCDEQEGWAAKQLIKFSQASDLKRHKTQWWADFGSCACWYRRSILPTIEGKFVS